MIRAFPLWYLLLLAAVPAFGAPPEAVAIALADARTLPKATANHTRYWDLTHLPPERQERAFKVLSFHVNSLSRESDITPPRRVVGGAVLAFDLRDYAIDPLAYGKLILAERYYHVEVEFTSTDQYGKQKKDRKTVGAPWLPTKETAELISLTNSQTPVTRGDWFFHQTSIQKDRVSGYYDFLGLGKKEADFQKLIGANVAEAKRLKLEMAASVATSGVTLNNRAVRRLQTLTGGYWFTQDYLTSTNKQNTARLLQGDTEPPQGDASEQYGVLPNGLFAYGLFDKDGNRQDTAPDAIASDSRSTSNDKRVHAGVSCVRCHVEGLRPIDDFARSMFRQPLELRSPDYDKLKRLRQLYLSDLVGQMQRDVDVFASRVRACNGLTVAQNASACGDFWQEYADLPVGVEDAAAECGVPVERLLGRIKDYAKAAPIADPVMAQYAREPPLPVRREHFEEIYPQLMQIVRVLP